jgi:hypothetical protein
MITKKKLGCGHGEEQTKVVSRVVMSEPAEAGGGLHKKKKNLRRRGGAWLQVPYCSMQLAPSVVFSHSRRCSCTEAHWVGAFHSLGIVSIDPMLDDFPWRVAVLRRLFQHADFAGCSSDPPGVSPQCFSSRSVHRYNQLFCCHFFSLVRHSPPRSPRQNWHILCVCRPVEVY